MADTWKNKHTGMLAAVELVPMDKTWGLIYDVVEYPDFGPPIRKLAVASYWAQHWDLVEPPEETQQ